MFELVQIGWTVGLDSRCCFINGCVVVYDSLETIETTSLGFDEIDIFGDVHIRDRNITMATAHHRYNWWHSLRHSINNNDGTIPKHYNNIWKKVKSMCFFSRLSFSVNIFFDLCFGCGSFLVQLSHLAPIVFFIGYRLQVKLVWTCVLLHIFIYAILFILFYLFPLAISSIDLWDSTSDSIGGVYTVGGNIVACDNNKGMQCGGSSNGQQGGIVRSAINI